MREKKEKIGGRREGERKETGEAHVGSYLKISLYHLNRSVPSDRRQAVSPGIPRHESDRRRRGRRARR